MLNFEYSCSTKIVFGKGQQKNVAGYIKEFGGSKVLLHHYGDTYPAAVALIADVKAALEEAGLTYVELTGVQPNPKLALCLQGAQIVRDEGCDFILAVGGGSVIDSAKCIAAAAHYDGDVWGDLFIGQQEFRAVDQGAGDSGALTFSAGEFCRAVMRPILQPDPFNQLDCPFFERVISAELCRQHNIFEHVQFREQVIRLEYKADFFVTQSGRVVFGIITAVKFE